MSSEINETCQVKILATMLIYYSPSTPRCHIGRLTNHSRLIMRGTLDYGLCKLSSRHCCSYKQVHHASFMIYTVILVSPGFIVVQMKIV